MTGSYITCDHPDCDATFRHYPGESWRIRGAAGDAGWATGDQGNDFCPRHAALELGAAA